MSSPSQHLSPELQQRFRRRTLSAAELAAVQEHLSGCAACRALVAPPTDHLTPQQFTELLEEKAPPETLAELRLHVRGCRRCAEQLRALETQRAQRAEPPRYPPSPADPFLPEFLRALRKTLLSGPAVAVMLGTAAGVGFFAFQLRPLQQRAGSDREALSQLTRERDELRQQVRELSARAGAARGDAAQLASLRSQTEALNRQQQTLQAALAQETTARKAAEQHGARPDTLFAFRTGKDLLALRPDGTLAGRVDPGQAVPAAVVTALREEKVPEAPELRRLDAPPPAPTGDPSPPLTLLSPVRCVVVSPQPVLTWKAAPAADAYEVTLTELQEGGGRKPSPPVRVNQATFTPAEPLQPGHQYEWEVKAFRGPALVAAGPQKPDPAARFRVMGRKEAETLQAQVVEYAGSPLLLGIFYAQNGLLDEAHRELVEVEKNNPGSLLAHKLVESIDTLRRPSKPPTR